MSSKVGWYSRRILSVKERTTWKPTAADAEHYAQAFSELVAMRAGFDLYRAFEQDTADSRAAIESNGTLTMPCLGLYRQMSPFSAVTGEMGLGVAEDVGVESVPELGHWIAEENLEALVERGPLRPEEVRGEGVAIDFTSLGSSRSKKRKSGGSNARHAASSTCPMPKFRSTRIASAISSSGKSHA